MGQYAAYDISLRHHLLNNLDDTFYDRAACRDVEDNRIFFPKGGTRSVRAQVATMEAKLICRRCPVKGRCLDYAVRAEGMEIVMAGIYGGRTEDERANTRKTQRRAG